MRARASAVMLLLAAALPARAADDAFDFYKEEAQVVTASRRAEPAWRAPAAVDVITADDIRAYGFKELWDALRFRAGMNVIEGRSLDGNRALVSARGFDKEFVAEMQVLVDGRSVYSPLLGGVYWQDIPVQTADIERIEIVRGPNAALYGSNAALGVINIITKKPGDRPAAAAGAWGGSRSAYSAGGSAEAGGPDAGLRVSFVSRADDGHPDSAGTAAGDDFLHVNKLHARGRWSPDQETEVEVLSGLSWMTAGIPGVTPDAETLHRQNFELARATRRLGGDDSSALEASVARSETYIDVDPLFAGNVDIRTYQYDAQLLHRFSWLDDRVKSSWGAEWRMMGADSNETFGDADPAHSSRLVRGFTHHSVELADPLTFVGGVSLEHSGTGGTQPAGQAALLFEPVDRHMLRLSYSYAPTIPPLLEKNALYRVAPSQTLVGNPDFGPERISSWEAGWSARLAGGAVRPSASLYYMLVSDYAGFVTAPGGPGLVQFANRDRAYARGAELSAEWSPARGAAVFANYTYERITSWTVGPALSTPRNMLNLGGRADVGGGVTVSSVLGYHDTFRTSSDSRGVAGRIPRHFRLDARVGWTARPGLELFVAGQELLQRTFTEYVDGTAAPRLVRGGVDWRFP